jgi:hypothetical protein
LQGPSTYELSVFKVVGAKLVQLERGGKSGRCGWRGGQGTYRIELLGQVRGLQCILIAWEVLPGFKQGSDRILLTVEITLVW